MLVVSVLLCFVLACSVHAQSGSRRFGPSCTNSPIKSDGFLLVLQWPIAFCVKNQKGCSLNAPLRRWTIHGLWPQFNVTKQEQVRELSGSPYPQYCCHRESQFNPQQLERHQEVVDKMKQNWFSLKIPNRGQNILTSSFSFWQHEWSKHGTCALNNGGRGRMTQEEYFMTAIKLAEQYQIGDWFKKAGVRPSNTRVYSRAQIHDALSTTLDKTTHGSFRLSCDRLPQSDGSVGVLSEIQICLDLELAPINCGHLLNGEIPRQRIEATTGAVDDHECGERVLLLSS